MFLSKEDYEEPRCPLSRPSSVEPIPIRRVIEKLDEHLSRNDYDTARRHLEYWLAEAKAGNDESGQLTVMNELIGLLRKTGKKEECLNMVEATVAFVEASGMEGTITMGTTLINAATAYKAFGKASDALPLFMRAREIYEKNISGADNRLGGLYNNMALTVMELGDYKAARELFHKALEVMIEVDGGEPEVAVTYCNLADLAAADPEVEDKGREIYECLDTAKAFLDTDGLPRDGNYAFVCEKCAPTFGYYGHTDTERELTRRSKEIYERD